MDFRRNKTYHDILAEPRPGGDEHLVTDGRARWLAAAGGMALYLLAMALLYWASGIGFQKRLGLQMELDTVPAWKHAIGLLLNTSAVGFSAIFLVSAVLWALKAASPKFFMVFGVLGLFAGLLVAFVL
ncbi:MAG: hypothetical protein AB7O49_12175 [Sphingomonadales bacterium]